jgi:hypothetical protein
MDVNCAVHIKLKSSLPLAMDNLPPVPTCNVFTGLNVPIPTFPFRVLYRIFKISFVPAVVCVAVITPDVSIRFVVKVCPDAFVNPVFAVINSLAIIVFVNKVPLIVVVVPMGAVIPPFAVISPDVFITFAVIVPSLINDCPGPDIVSPTFAVINPDDVIVLVEIEVPTINPFGVSAVPDVVGFQLVLIEIREDTFSNCAVLKTPIRLVDDDVNVDNTLPLILNSLPDDILISPFTSNLYVACDAVPIPTLPDEYITNLSSDVDVFTTDLILKVPS